MKDVSGSNGQLGPGENLWPRVGENAPANVDVPEWPLVDVADHGSDSGPWEKL